MGQYSHLVEEHKRKSQHIWGCQSLIHHCHEIWRTAIRLAVDGGHWEFVHPLIEAWRILGSPRSHSLDETTGFGTPLEACCNLRCPSQALHISSQSFLLARTSGCSIWLYLAVLSRPNRLIVLGISLLSEVLFGWTHSSNEHSPEDLRSPLTAALEKGQVQARSAWHVDICSPVFSRITSLETWKHCSHATATRSR